MEIPAVPSAPPPSHAGDGLLPPPPAILVRDAGGTIQAWSPGCERLFGIPAEGALGRPAHALLGTVFPVPPAAVEAALLTTGHWSGELLHHLPDGRTVRVAASWLLLDAADGGGPAWRVVETAIPLEAGEWRPPLSLLSQAAGFVPWAFDLASGRLSLGPGIPVPEGGGDGPRRWLGLLLPEDRRPALRAARAALRQGAPFVCRCRFRLRAGAGAAGPRWIEARGGLVGHGPAEGARRRVIGIALDISERKAEEERTALLMREVDHRARNALAIVQALLRLVRAETPEALARALEGRIAALGRAQTLLASREWPGAELRAVLEGEFAPYVAAGGTAATPVVLDGPPVMLAAGAVQPLSMVVHELVTNAAKHGALSHPEGRVTLVWTATAEGLRLVWRERGGPPVMAPPRRRGFGSNLLQSVVRGQLGGAVTLRWRRAGLVCEIRLPAAGVLAPSPPAGAPPGGGWEGEAEP